MTTSLPSSTASEASLLTWTNVIYLLHAFSLLTGILGAPPDAIAINDPPMR